MPNVIEALELLCQCMRSLINVELEPKDLISAYDNIVDYQIECKLRHILLILSDYSVKLKGYNRNDIYDSCHSDKLNFAILQYPMLEFYVPQANGGTRVLLIALAWLLGTEDVLTLIHRMKLTKSIRTDNFDDAIRKSRAPLPISAELEKISYLNAKVNMNLKEISELRREWSRLASKIGEASREHFGRKSTTHQDLPDLKACEIALTKRIALLGGKASAEDQKKLQEFNDAQKLLEVHVKWLEVRHVFFDWMAIVTQEHRKTMKHYSSKIMKSELEHFTSYLCRLIDGRYRYLKTSGKTFPSESQKPLLDPPSRLKKCRCNSTEAQKWLDEISKCVVAEEESRQKHEKQLVAELREVLEQIPSIYHV
ncbi:uncharacterized protein LOC116847378 [Odontomachus brunneus]|uniref:uncharacterized protein LOC116847378 n=1 Tax=Odontomachus brunneus TaxID=486640 RepID=UPI0013F1BD0B|nr:uncharacterized protein LOC116847378 [Odontomachus brunneus]XP_032678207.1 uncharacterized protein LOC116847378 [Odontomachus brunneus]XP_032678208.1 uncharacterized protein LOC116847378 [Odontomachus brunneus]XP_032678209.1 uncharacterized protein LOC116847378 [Odontomachus brunneus]